MISTYWTLYQIKSHYSSICNSNSKSQKLQYSSGFKEPLKHLFISSFIYLFNSVFSSSDYRALKWQDDK